jgi:hypothetical protein
MSAAADRMRRHRARRKAGRLRLTVEVDDVATPERLVEAGYLARSQMDDPAAIARALEQAVADFTLVDISRSLAL